MAAQGDGEHETTGNGAEAIGEAASIEAKQGANAGTKVTARCSEPSLSVASLDHQEISCAVAKLSLLWHSRLFTVTSICCGCPYPSAATHTLCRRALPTLLSKAEH